MQAGKKSKIAAAATIPALGLMAGAIATAGSPAQAQSQGQAQSQAVNCRPNAGHTGIGQVGRYSTSDGIYFNKQSRCIHSQFLNWKGSHTGLTERIRYYNARGHLTGQGLRGGVIRSGYTMFGSTPNIRAYKVSLALVQNRHINHVVVGPYTFTTNYP